MTLGLHFWPTPLQTLHWSRTQGHGRNIYPMILKNYLGYVPGYVYPILEQHYIPPIHTHHILLEINFL